MSLSKHEYKIADLVIDDEYGIISATDSVAEAAKKMKELNVPDLVVIDKEKKVLGVIGDFDIVQNIVAQGKDPRTTTAKQAMFVIDSITLDTPVTEAFAIMQKLNANVIPVVEKGKLLGVTSMFDVWGFIPDETIDDVGWIPVHNPKSAEFWFTTGCALFAFLFSVIFPISGIVGYFSTETSELGSLIYLDIRGGSIKFYLLEAHSRDFFISYFQLMGEGGFWWVLTTLCGIFVLISGIIGLISLVYASYSDFRNQRTRPLVKSIFPMIFIGFLVLEWILFIIAFKTPTPSIPIQIDGWGLTFTIISIILVIAGIYRDLLFRTEENTATPPQEAS